MPLPEATSAAAAEPAAAFSPHRRRLLGIAYRMVGSVAEAEDIVQEAYLRWHEADRAGVHDPAAFLARIVTRLSLDHLKSARVRRQTYVGPWLPEPLVEAPDQSAEGEHVTLTLMLALERLSPLERGAFLLHDVFGLGFAEIARTLGRDAAACRQLAARARQHVRSAKPRFALSRDEGRRIADAFFHASRSGDLGALQALLAADVVATTDGGGKRPAALRPIVGAPKVARFLLGLARKAAFQMPPLVHRGPIDGLPGFVTLERGGVLQTTALEVDASTIRAIYVVRNPDKVRHLAWLDAAAAGRPA